MYFAASEDGTTWVSLWNVRYIEELKALFLDIYHTLLKIHPPVYNELNIGSGCTLQYSISLIVY